jgi:RNA polymerase II subunit A-like phosphatase
MSKQISLGKKLKYPITITKLLKRPGDSFQKEDPVFQYTFTWYQEVGDPFGGDTWQEKQTTIADWGSPADGKILAWKVHEGQTIDKDTTCMEIEETCSHPVQFAGLCAVCGKDMNETSWAAEGTDADRATVNMIHDQTLLAVSVDEASKAETELQRRLLKHRKLSLVVDLDQTIIHACIDPTVGEWQRDPQSPNYDAVKDVKAFQLNDDGPRGLTSGCWYYIKMRPGLRDFLAHVAELYELHVYTMGTRAYAQNIAKIVDPEHRLFGDRIISRDENGSLTAKTLSRLFPVDTKMVVIIDDRADVWPKNRPNLIKVVPYDFFPSIGDINSSFLPKRQDLPKAVPSIKLRVGDKSDDNPKANVAEGAQTTSEAKNGSDEVQPSAENEKVATPADGESRLSALEELVSMGGGDDPTIRRIQAEEQETFLEKQLIERPLLHMQQELDKEDEENTSQSTNGNTDETVKEGAPVPEHPHHRHHLLKDDDRELIYLEKHLQKVHKAFFEEYDRSLAGATGGRVAHLRPGSNKKVSLKDESADLKLVPDIADVMPGLKSKILAGTHIVLSGLVPLGIDVERSEIGLQAISFGAQIQTKISRKVTHVVVSPNRTRTQKVRQALEYPHIKIVSQQWLMDSMSKWQKEDETPHLVSLRTYPQPVFVSNQAQIQIRREDRGLDSNTHSMNSSSDDSLLDTDDEADNELLGNNDEPLDPDGVIPSALSDPTSPIDDLQKFDWGSADAELEEFMASGSDGDESDTSSIASSKSQPPEYSIGD